MVADGTLSAAEAFVFGAAPAPTPKAKATGFVIPDLPPAPPAAPAPLQEPIAIQPIRVKPVTAAKLPPAPAPAPAARTSAQEAIAIARILEEMRPTFQADGGDVTLLDVDGNRVSVEMTGACAGCQIASLTLGGLRKRIREQLGRDFIVVPAPRN
nr:NifU family protein [Tropicimonas isoalkanivorans]